MDVEYSIAVMKSDPNISGLIKLRSRFHDCCCICNNNMIHFKLSCISKTYIALFGVFKLADLISLRISQGRYAMQA